MAYINVPEGVPGIRSLALFRPETAQPLYELAQVLLRGPSPLTPAERELIATHVSNRNNCSYCMNSHGAAARSLYQDDQKVVDCVIEDVDGAPVSDKLRTLLHIAGKVQVSGREVTPEDIAAAREMGADDREIHDTVLIAAAFCMYNRYVDGLNTSIPEDPNDYVAMGDRLAAQGYVSPKEP